MSDNKKNSTQNKNSNNVQQRIIISKGTSYKHNYSKAKGSDNTGKNKKETSYIKIFLVSIGISIIITLIVLALFYFFARSQFEKSRLDKSVSVTENVTENGKNAPLNKIYKLGKKSIDILVIGVDREGYLADSIMLVHYDRLSKSTSLISVPRDYKVDLSKETRNKLGTSHQFVKITELHSYVKLRKKNKPDLDIANPEVYIKKAVEEYTGIDIDHVVVLQLEAFIKIVDEVGGVDVYVPQDYYYNDPRQGLRINLKKGYQHLDGKQAEGFVRFRQGRRGTSYGDPGRNDIQQYFLTSFIKKVVSPNTILNFNKIIDSVSDFIKTDATFEEALQILNEVKGANFNRVFSHRLPGTDKIIGRIYFYVPPKVEQLHDLVKNWIIADNEEEKDSHKFKILLFNAGNTDKKVREIAEKLKQAGYDAEYTGKYVDRSVKSIIKVPERGYGLDIKAYSSFSELIVGDTKDNAIYFYVGKIE